MSTCCRLLQLRGGEPPQADYSTKKAIRHYCLVASQIIVGGAPRAPAESKAVCRYNLIKLIRLIMGAPSHIAVLPGLGTGSKKRAADAA